MNIITTTKSIHKIDEYLCDLNASSCVFVLYEPEESVSVADLALTYDTHAKLVFIKTDSRDDKLLCVGGIRVRMDCEILDEELVCPSEFLDKINGVFGGYNDSARNRQQKSVDFVANPGQRKSAPSSIKEAMSSASTAAKVKASDLGKSTGAGTMNLSKKSQVLYDAIGLSASDVGFLMGTDALMQAIANVIARSATVEDAAGKIQEMESGDMIWAKVAPKYDELKRFLA